MMIFLIIALVLYLAEKPSYGFRQLSSIRRRHYLSMELADVLRDAKIVTGKILDTAEDSILHLRRGFVAQYQEKRPTQRFMTNNDQDRKRLVLLGSGWSSHALSKIIETDLYEVLCISPRPYFIFTPMLAATAVGSVEYRSIVESVRESNPLADYIQGEVTDIFPSEQIVSVQTAVGEVFSAFNVSYDILVHAIGSRVADFGVKGVKENCYFIKEVEDVRKLKAKIITNLELALLPDTTEAEVDRLLTSVIVGGGPTGVEFIGELEDFIKDKVSTLYPRLLSKVKLVLLNAGPTILTAFDSALRRQALNSIISQGVDVRLNARVTSINNTTVTFESIDTPGEVLQIDYGLCVWAAGNAPRELTMKLAMKVGQEQKQMVEKTGRLTVDPWLRLTGKGFPFGSIFVMGDCSRTTGESITGVNGDPPLPQTAQVAGQQGAYVARLLNRKYELTTPIPVIGSRIYLDNPIGDTLRKSGVLNASPFTFLNLGLLAYVGREEAVAQVSIGKSDLLQASGQSAYLLWKSVYLVKQVSLKTRVLVLFDYFKTWIFGRDLTSV